MITDQIEDSAGDGQIGPTAGRHRLGAELRRLRMARSLRLVHASAKLGVAESTLSRIETGKAPIRPLYLATLLDLYEIHDPAQRRQLADMGREGQRKEWWSDYARVLPAGVGQYLCLETAAAEVCAYSALTIPGAIQTRRYTRAACLATRPGVSSQNLNPVSAVQARRQERLRHNDVRLRLVIDESALLRYVGSAHVMAEQLEHVREVAGGSQVSVQVIRLSTAGAALFPSFALLRLRDQPMPGIACYEGIGGQVLLSERPADVTAAHDNFGALERAAEPEAKFTAMIESAVAFWKRRAAEEG